MRLNSALVCPQTSGETRSPPGHRFDRQTNVRNTIAFGERDDGASHPRSGRDNVHAHRCGQSDARSKHFGNLRIHSFNASLLVRESTVMFINCRPRETSVFGDGLVISLGGSTGGCSLSTK